MLVPKPVSDNESVVKQLREKSGNQDIHLCGVDMTSLRSIRKFATEFSQKNDAVDFLINNAGKEIFSPPEHNMLKVNFPGRPMSVVRHQHSICGHSRGHNFSLNRPEIWSECLS